MQLKNYKEKVYRIMDEIEQTRNDDGLLIAHFINKHCKRFVRKDVDGDLCIRLKDIRHLPPFESVRRSRAIIQNVDGKLLPTDPAVMRARRIKEKNMRNAEVREANEHVVT